MKKILTIIILIAAVVFCLASCREASTVVQSPIQPEASSLLKTYADRFDYFWRAMNSHYVFWDVDPTDWDAVYTKYLPMFEELDKTISEAPAEKKAEVIETAFDTAVQYYTDSTKTLVDHHMAIRIFDPYRANKSCDDYIRPGNHEVTTRDYYHSDTLYTDGQYPILWTEATDVASYFEEGGIGTPEDGYKTKTNLMSAEERAVTYYGEDKTAGNTVVESYCIAYDFTVNKKNSSDSDMHVVYLAMSNYYATKWLPTYLDSPEKCPADSSLAFQWKAGKTIITFFATVKKYYDSNELAGIIIDNRGNGGGYNYDLNWFLGYYIDKPVTVAYSKYKEGFGKTDYSSEIPYTFATNTSDKEVGNYYCNLEAAGIPYVILCDLNSVSNGEITTAGVKSMSNGYVIGERTWGGTGLLIGTEPEGLVWTYGGTFGDATNGPVYTYTSTWNTRTFTDDGYKSLEGIGVTPDKEIPFKSTGEDNLIEDTQTMLKSQVKEAFSYISNH